MIGALFSPCVKKPSPDMEYYSDLPLCSARPILHCWHEDEGKDAPVCCWCKKELEDLGDSKIISEDAFWAYYKILERFTGAGKIPVIHRVLFRIHETTIIGGRSFADCIETHSLPSGIRRLYLLYNTMCHWTDLGKKLQQLGILKANMDALRTGEIPKKYRKEALKEIEWQASYLPQKQSETRANRKTKAVQSQIDRLKRSPAAKKRTK